MVTRCYACDRVIKGIPKEADTRDDQIVYVGPDCHAHIIRAGDNGYQPTKGGPRLYPMARRIVGK